MQPSSLQLTLASPPLHSCPTAATRQRKKEEDKLSLHGSFSAGQLHTEGNREETDLSTDATILTFRDGEHRYVSTAEAAGVSGGETLTFSSAREEGEVEGV